MNLKNIHIGETIRMKIEETQIPMSRICKFLDVTEEEVVSIYNKESIDTDQLLRWSKLLEYDFFRLYTSHIMLYRPIKNNKTQSKSTSKLPVFRKSIYTQEIKDFIIGKIKKGEMTPTQVTTTYNIPKTTLHKWLRKI